MNLRLGNGLPLLKLSTWAAALVLSAACTITVLGANPQQRTTPPHPAVARPATHPSPKTATRPATPAPSLPVAKTNPLLPKQIAIDGFMADLSLSPKTLTLPPAGFAPLASAADWQIFRQKFGTEADDLSKQKPSGQIAFSQKLIDLAAGPEPDSSLPIGTRRAMLIRAAAIAYRTKDGFTTADKAVQFYYSIMDKSSPTQVGALWSLANIMSRTAVTPKPDRIRYDAIAAKANMQLALLMLQVDQIAAAESILKQIGYHEGWLKSDPATRQKIAQVRADVKQDSAMMEYLATQYQPALKNDVTALTMLYLYGRFVKVSPSSVSDLPARVPESSLAQMASLLDGASQGTDMTQTFNAAENLRMAAANVADTRIRQRTLYAAMQLYDAFMASPTTERDRIRRTLARIAREGVVADGARKGNTIDPFAAPPSPTPVAPRTAPPDTVMGVAAL